jgi:hypothetical protein
MRQFGTYAIILVLIIVAGIALIAGLGQNASNTFATVKDALPTGS